ncbi:MAG: ATP synthase F1 subunit epsilon [Candidatus Levybacteria bacterium]|nr:ATP synthase F1 subunit epsilon [Candidatus Levybacteria bacterium]
MFQLQILSPVGEIFNDTVDEVTLPTDKGEISILPHHTTLFSKLEEGTITVKKGGKKTIVAIVGGFLEVKKDHVSILSDYAIKAENIEIARANEAKKRAEDFIANKQSTADLIMAERELQKSLLELKVAGKIKHHS